MKTICLILLLACAGCATKGPERTLKYHVPEFQYEQFEPVYK